MKWIFVFSTLIFCNFSSCGQDKDTIDVCSLLSDKPSVMAFDISSKRCIPNSQGLKVVEEQIDKSFATNARVIGVTSFYVNKYHFVERVYKSSLCDTVAILFIAEKDKKVIRSKGYKINNISADFRMTNRKNEIILYRKIKNKGKEATASFELNKVNYRIDSFIDDGLSVWY
jgi:hypothetical protein